VFLQEAEGGVERHVRLQQPVRRLGDLADGRRARVEPGSDHLADERLARDDADEAAVVADVDCPHLRLAQVLARLLRRRGALERLRIRDHRVADTVGHG